MAVIVGEDELTNQEEALLSQSSAAPAETSRETADLLTTRAAPFAIDLAFNLDNGHHVALDDAVDECNNASAVADLGTV
ncbi:hypothetical protein L218DRAFT_1010530 [Marasmius fiardii PR-910]|nr:hypothetical protein L218DRAFT_1010530 [Marasmius fiardii PR-910]